jgi:hypothetical protein
VVPAIYQLGLQGLSLSYPNSARPRLSAPDNRRYRELWAPSRGGTDLVSPREELGFKAQPTGSMPRSCAIVNIRSL